MTTTFNGPITIIKMAQDKEYIKKVQESTNYIQILEYPKNMTFESMLLTLVNEVDKLPLIHDDAKEPTTVCLGGKTWTPDDPFTFEKAEMLKSNYVAQQNEYNLTNVPMTSSTFLNSIITPDYNNGPIANYSNNSNYYNNYNNGIVTGTIDIPTTIDLKMFMPGVLHGPDNIWKPISTPVIGPYSDYYTFKDCRGISSTQTIIKYDLSQKHTVLPGNYMEKKIHTIGANYDAISNIRVKITHFGQMIIADNLEFVLKVNGNLLCSQTVMNQQIINCDFIKLPNFITKHPKIESQKVEIYVRAKKECLNFTHMDTTIKIDYDVILFDNVSRAKIFNECNIYMFETATGVICVGTKQGIFGTRYMTQLLDTVSTDFSEHLYSSNLLANKEKEKEGEDDHNKEEISENIKITI